MIERKLAGEMKRALERHEAGDARVIPVILRPYDWHQAPFGKLLAAPKDGKPVTKWANADEAFLDIANAIRAAAHKKEAGRTARPEPAAARPTDLQRAVREDKDRFLFEMATGTGKTLTGRSAQQGIPGGLT